MAFNLQNLVPLGGQSSRTAHPTSGALRRGGPQMWSYISGDAPTVTRVAGYFNADAANAGAYNMLEIGDLIYAVEMVSGALVTASLLVVKDKASGTIDTTNATALTVADSD